jgi:hypothetical protein
MTGEPMFCVTIVQRIHAKSPFSDETTGIKPLIEPTLPRATIDTWVHKPSQTVPKIKALCFFFKLLLWWWLKWGLMNYLSRPALNLDLPDLSLPCSWDYGCEPLVPDLTHLACSLNAAVPRKQSWSFIG